MILVRQRFIRSLEGIASGRRSVGGLAVTYECSGGMPPHSEERIRVVGRRLRMQSRIDVRSIAGDRPAILVIEKELKLAESEVRALAGEAVAGRIWEASRRREWYYCDEATATLSLGVRFWGSFSLTGPEGETRDHPALAPIARLLRTWTQRLAP
jgi:hypothetical protein